MSSDDHPLPVTGVIPPDLCGRLLRNGPNPAVVPADESDYHWLSGDGMIHAVTLSEGRAEGYRNHAAREEGGIEPLTSAAPGSTTSTGTWPRP